MAPWAAMRDALLLATLSRQPFHVSGPRPFAARSWLMSACCVDPMTIAGGAGLGAGGGGGAAAGGAAGAGAAVGGGVGLGSGLGLGIIRWRPGSFSVPTPG